jgi:hypothetical protein
MMESHVPQLLDPQLSRNRVELLCLPPKLSVDSDPVRMSPG